METYIALSYHGETARNNRMVADIEDQVPPLIGASLCCPGCQGVAL